MRAIVLVAGAGALLAVTAYWYFPSSRLLARRMGQVTESVPAEEISRHLRQLPLLGDEGLRSLVRAIGSERDDVSESAAIIMDEQLEAWRELPASESSRRVSAVATLLAQYVDSFDASSRRRAAQISTQILLWPIDRDAVDGAELVEQCARVLEARSDTIGLEETEIAIRELDIPMVPGTEGTPEQAGDFSPNSIQQRLPPSITEIGRPPRQLTTTPVSQNPRPASDRAPDGFPSYASPTNEQPNDERTPELYKVPSPVGVADSDAVPPTAVFAPRAQPVDLNGLADMGVMRSLHSSSSRIGAMAEAELAKRGYREMDIRLARRLVDPDPKVRLKLVTVLPSLAGVDPRPWLLQLMRDEDALVRRAAASVLSTSNDPLIQKRLREPPSFGSLMVEAIRVCSRSAASHVSVRVRANWPRLIDGLGRRSYALLSR